jgi:Spy/CpxP family protein refolding chaperone
MSDTDTHDNLTIDYAQKLHRWRMAFFGVVILLAGMVIGGASMVILVPQMLIKPPPGPEFESEMMLPLLRRDLDLTPEQTDKIKPIMDKYMGKLNQIRMNARTQVRETLKQMNKEIAVILTDEQKQVWQQGLDKLQKELRPGGWRRGQGPGGGRFRRGEPGSERPDFRRGPGPGPFGPPRFPSGPNFPRNRSDRNDRDTNEPPAEGNS